MFTYPITQTGNGYVPGAFDLLVASYNPWLFYNFQDTDLSTLSDSGSLGVDLVSQNTLDAEVIAPLRSTTVQALSTRGWTLGNHETEAAHYREAAGTAFNDYWSDTSGNTNYYCFMFTFKVSTDAWSGTNPDLGIFGSAPDPWSTAAKCYFYIDGVSKELEYQIRHNTGNATATFNAGVTYNDGLPHIAAIWQKFPDDGNRKTIVDGVTTSSGTPRTLDTYTSSYFQWGAPIAPGADNLAVVSDHASAWSGGTGDVPTEAQVIAMQNQWIAELV